MWQEGGEAPFESTSDTKGDDIQKLNVIQTLPSLLAGDAQSCISRLMPKMQQTLPTASTEFHVAASTTFKTILEQRLVSHSTFTQTFLQSILNSLDSRDPVVAHAWLETLLDVIELLPAEVIRHEILPMAINKGQLSQPISSRITCSKLVGKICTRFDSQLIKKEVLPTVHSLCQDVNSDVRACICLQLRYVAEGLGAEFVKPALLPSIVELASDEESIVRHASVQTIVHLLPQLQTDVIKSTIAPLIKKLCDNALKSDDNVICVIAQEFGKLALGLEKCLTPGEKTWLIKYFQQLSQLGVPTIKKESAKQEFPFMSNNPLVNERYVECRWQCAFNIPAMFLFVSSASEDVDVLLPTFNDLAGDPYYMVRRTIACGIHEVAKILGPRNSLIKGDFIKLLKDDSEEVLQGLIPHVAKTCELLSQSQTIGTDKIDSSVMDLGRALLKCEAEIATTNNWRLSASMFEQMEILPKCFPSDLIYTYFVPVALSRALNARPMPVRLAAGRTFLVFLRYNLKAAQRTELRNRLYTEFAINSNSYVRMLFIRMMIEAMDIFSSMYFKEYFYTTVLSLTEDPIANVRLKVVTLLPSLKSFIRLPSDKKLLASLEANVRNLMNNEKDRDVIFALTQAIHKLDGIDVKHEGQPPPAKVSKHDSDDLKKYEEEKRLLNIVPSKAMPAMTPLVAPALASKKIPMAPKVTGATRINPADMVMGRSGRQNSLAVDPQRSSVPTVLPKAKQPGVPISMSEPPSRASRQNSSGPRISDMSKASTSSNDLTSSWAQLTSNSMLLTHLWERINLSDSNVSVSSNNRTEGSCHDYMFHEPYDFTDHTHINRYDMPHACEPQYRAMNLSSGSYYNPDIDYSKSRINNTLYKHDCYPPSAFSKTLLLSHLKKERNTCWTFSSMPEIPVPLQDDEFLVDAGIRIPAQLSSCHSTSRIPKLQEIIYRNRRIVGNGDRSCSGDSSCGGDRSRSGSVNLDKGKAKRHFSMHEDCLKQRSASVDQAKSNRSSMNYDDGPRQRSKCNLDEQQQFVKDDSRSKRYSTPRGKVQMGFEVQQGKSSDEKGKRCLMRLDKTKQSQPKSTSDWSKRHSSAIYSSYLPDYKDSKQKFKRHSLEVSDCNPPEKGIRLKRNFTLDVNHNQGTSKISSLRSALASGSRTAPVTRASSPIRAGPHLTFDRDDREDKADYSMDRHLSKFSSSDEEVDKLCIRFAYLDPPYIRNSRSSTTVSRLPVWMRRKKP